MLQRPEIESADYYERARFRLTWNINLFLVISLFIMTGLFSIFEPRFVFHYSAGFIITLGGVLYLKFKKEYKPVAITLSTIGALLVSSSIFFVPRAVHYIEPFWLFIITLYVFFTLGRVWGIVHLAANAIAVALFFTLKLNDNLEIIEPLTFGQQMMMSGEFLLCVMQLGYIIDQFIRTNAYAEEKYRTANRDLLAEKKNVESQNEEKTLLLQEIHHRVKNNLQVITSLLRIQSSKIVSQEARDNFQDAINRIMTMSLIHQKMYEKENLAEIDLSDYFESLVNDLIHSNSPEKKVDCEICVEVEKVGAKSIVPLALIITELVTNSIKHAFDNKETGMINLHISPSDKAFQFHMKYRDNGTWKADQREGSFGLQLIDTFTEQLDGSYERNTENGESSYEFVLTRIDAL